jgi:hypothetical protein
MPEKPDRDSRPPAPPAPATGAPRPADDPDAEPTEAERAEADRLRAALEDPAGGANDDADLARALRAAWAPRDLPAVEHRALVDRALASLPARRPERRRRTAIRVSFAAGAVAALAACVLLVVSTAQDGLVGAPSATLSPRVAITRSTQDLFAQPFAATGGATARIDRIALARAADLRDNEFAKWGVR